MNNDITTPAGRLGPLAARSHTTRLRFTGSLKDGALELTRDRDGATTAGNGGTFVAKTNPKQTFRLKRLY